MTELLMLKERIRRAGALGVKTAHIRDDYEPVGANMIRDLVATGEYVTMRVRAGFMEHEWRIFLKDEAPYSLES
jgi:hypothetical protein